MNKIWFKDKIITIMAMLIIIVGLSLISYCLFIRVNQVDICEYLVVEYSGESGNAKAKASLSQKNFNERIQYFMDNVEFEVTPNENLKNGDIITVEAIYDEEIADRYHIKPINYKKTLAVNDLAQRIEDVKDIPHSFLLEINDKGQNYLTKYHDDIINDFNLINKDDTNINDITLLSRLFMNSKSNTYGDMIVDVYQIQASNGNEIETLYYLIFYREINDSFKIYDENVFGEKCFVNKDSDNDTVIKEVIKKYSKNYQCDIIY